MFSMNKWRTISFDSIFENVVIFDYKLPDYGRRCAHFFTLMDRFPFP